MTDHSLRVPPEKYYASLNRKRMFSSVLFRDEHSRVLLLEPSYKPFLDLPGGVVEENESPWLAAVREVREELGIDIALGRLLAVDYLHAYGEKTESVGFVFDGGILADDLLNRMDFVDGEVLSACFYAVQDVEGKVKTTLACRLESALYAITHNVTVLCEDGKLIT